MFNQSNILFNFIHLFYTFFTPFFTHFLHIFYTFFTHFLHIFYTFFTHFLHFKSRFNINISLNTFYINIKSAFVMLKYKNTKKTKKTKIQIIRNKEIIKLG